MNTTQTDDQTYVAKLAAALGETESTPIAQLARFVERCGQRLAQRLLFKAEQIEKSGGQFWGHDKTKRRTKGGVFFQLARKAARGTGHYAYIFPRVTRTINRHRVQHVPQSARAQNSLPVQRCLHPHRFRLSPGTTGGN